MRPFLLRGLRASLLISILATVACDAPPEMIGRAAPDFTVNDGERAVALHDLRGRVVVLNFWATWCPPCVEEMPSLIEMQRQTRDRVIVFAVSVDTDVDIYHRF